MFLIKIKNSTKSHRSGDSISAHVKKLIRKVPERVKMAMGINAKITAIQ